MFCKFALNKPQAMKITFQLVIAIICFTLCSCANLSNQIPTEGEGQITYSITYTGNPGKMETFLPHETIFTFKNKNASFITSAMGIIQVINLLENDNKKFTTLLINGMGENFAFTDTPEDVKIQENIPQYKIEPTEETKTIAGFKCKKAIVNDLTNNKKFEIFYYEKKKVYLGNSPYKDFNYLLLDYRDTKQGLEMHLEATKVDFNPIDTSLLSVHGNFKWVDKNAFLSIIENIRAPL